MFRAPLQLLPVLLLFVACSGGKQVVSTHPDGKPEVIIWVEGKDAEAQKVMEKVFYPNGQLEYVGRFRNGVEHGEWRYYFDDGTPKVIERWENGLEHGLRVDYAPDGQVERETTFDKGRVVNTVEKPRR